MADLRCEFCETPFERVRSRGPAPRYCSGNCRSHAYIARRVADGSLTAEESAYLARLEGATT